MDVPDAVPTALVATRRSGSRRVAIATAFVLAVSLIRPWDAVVPPGPPAHALAPRLPDAADPAARLAAAATPDAPSPQPSLLPDQIACNPGGWTVVSLDRLGPWTVRSWVPARPVLADGPLDPRIGRLTLESPEVLAIGACRPSVVDPAGTTVAGGAARFVGAWRIDGTRATPVDLGIRGADEPASVATLYRPKDATATAAGPAHWPGGVYVVRLALDAQSDDPSRSWFLALVVRDPA